MFESRNEWFTHELQAHRHKWLCYKCDYVSTDRDDFESHQKELHLSDFTEAQISTLAETCQRPVNEIPLADCPVCHTDAVQSVSGAPEDISSKLYPNTLSVVNFRRHLGRHLEQFALFVLPRDYDDEDGKDFNSNDAESDVQSGLARSWMNSEASSSIIEFSASKTRRTNTPVQFPQHVSAHLDAFGDKLVVFCHACRNEWFYEDEYYEVGEINCPQCKTNATQIVSHGLHLHLCLSPCNNWLTV